MKRLPKSELPETTITATLHDSEGPLRRLALWPLIAASLVSAAVPLAHWSPSASIITALLGAMIASFTRLLPRARSRSAKLLVRKGRVRVREAGLLDRVLRPKDVVGATTARLGHRFVLTLSLRARPAKPIHFELDSVEHMTDVCDALGVGHHGYGVVGFDLRAQPQDKVETVLRVGVGFGLGLTGIVLADRPDFWFLVMLVPWALGPFVLLAYLMRAVARPLLYLRGDAMFVSARRGWSLPYRSIEQIATTETGIVVNRDAIREIDARPSSWMREGMSAAEREILVAQITAASRRAHGKSALKDDASTALDALRRGSMSIGQWLSHLDGIAAAASSGGAYRGVTFNASDLSRTFEDPDGDPELRAAAGRILLRLAPEETRARVGPVLETVRDDDVRTRLALTIDEDAVHAERELGEARGAEARADGSRSLTGHASVQGVVP